ncbi:MULTISPECIES: histidine phosphatase family protein [Gordonia]|jgi:probable phosphoglycerate mutase|uniref:Phosphoglycerate kinase n=2 Tax=Gordonia alkanivorans TaxID=84096 RepID=W9DGV6_9ACTN|nr:MULTISPECIES: histidine phosphatase family protein [Gordonia]AZZ80335.1 histidine phosphatase family protein [Gordonia alkanivorans]ETA07697.1 phosphoglycerate kinase [Gordonia alkanivorans CGMCC 6845]MDH3007558.1 histidine phosphatase family protein [Gordonia alkanivorans]MDH3013752.1 histidine phosphatase family protein [Gordonia alkanivorans]MDH3015255.1 histidine phosphatase family protein [Gordonia alkanivorans]
MARLHLVRHGETTANVMRRLDTALPGAALTDFGARQGARFGLENRPEREAVLFSSEARRARQTAELIGSVWDVHTEAVDGVHEVQAGELEDRSDREAHHVFHDVMEKWHAGDLDVRIPGGESLAMVYDRYIPTVDDLARSYLTGTEPRDVFLVSHGAAIRLIAARLAGIDSRFAAATHLGNTGSIELEYADGIWVCHRWGAETAPFDRVDEPLVDDPMG